MQQNGIGSLTTILKRLEAATSRLEDLALSQAPGQQQQQQQQPQQQLHNNNAASSSAAAAATGAAMGAGAGAAATPASVSELREMNETALKRYVTLSNKLGGLVAQQAALVERAFVAQADFVELASKSKQVPSTSPAFTDILKPIQEPLMAAVEVKDKNRGASKELNFLSTVAEGMSALGWLTLDSKPGPFVAEMRDAAQFYANRVVKDNKGTNDDAVEWAKAFTGLLEDLRKYIMTHHTTGLKWNPNGGDATAASTSSKATPAAPPPPPPAAPVAPAPMDVDTPKAPAAGNMSSVFASLNQGEAITSGLRKVKPTEMTHKNPELRAAAASAVPTATTTPAKAPKPASLTNAGAKTQQPPKKVLEGNKWTVENFDGESITIDETELNQIVNVYNVRNSTIVIRGKVNAVSLVNCRKTSVLLDSLVSSLAISTSPSFTVQILGAVPTLQIDGTDGGQVYLSKASLGIEIITAKSSALNISLPVDGEEDGVFEEKPVPEQIKTVVQAGKLVSSIVEHTA